MGVCVTNTLAMEISRKYYNFKRQYYLMLITIALAYCPWNCIGYIYIVIKVIENMFLKEIKLYGNDTAASFDCLL